MEKAVRSRLETAYRKNKSALNLSNLRKQSRRVCRLITAAKRLFYRSFISSNKDNPKKLWTALNSVLNRSVRKILPDADSPSALAKSFLSYFDSKITRLCSLIPTEVPFDPTNMPSLTNPPTISEFSPATTDEIRMLILRSTNASCTLDIIPTKLLKSCVDAFVQPITNLINMCLAEGVFPDAFKKAIVTPLLKKHSFPKDDLSSYRPISNLNFISKILERVIYSRLCDHLEKFPSLSPFQSAYRKLYSTETALNRIQNDLLLAMNRRQVSALVLLDLSAAFDTIDHDILLSRLQSSFGLSDTAFQLLSSYLCNRSQSVQIDQSSSDELPLLRGVPQGSVLGPLLFTLYTTPLSHLLTASSIHFHLYADDTQLYVSFTSPDSSESLAKLSATLDQVFRWFCSNRLSVNPSKTEYLLIGTPQQRCKVTDSSVFFNGLTLLPTDSARNLGVIFDSDLKFEKHISATCRSSFFQIRQLRQIRSSLDFDSAVILANSLVHSKLDYCNSLLNGLPATSIVRLQHVQNSLARVVCKSSNFRAHTSSLLRKLHWLPVADRIKFKIATLTYKTLHFSKPSYLADLLVPYIPSRVLRSADESLLVVPDVRSVMGRRSFSYSAPKLWNALPLILRSCSSLTGFCSKLKTHLFPP
jgi:hypothetical protein